ncbi:hypothetical protein CRG98_049458, partial [Punica granatum]
MDRAWVEQQASRARPVEGACEDAVMDVVRQ